MLQERNAKKVFKNVPEEKRSVGKQERNGWMMVKMILRKWVLEVAGKWLGIETPGN
jgi:hypothetical protein